MKTLVTRYDKKSICELPIIQFQGRIIVIQSKEEAKKAVDYLLSQKIIGIDTETKPVFKKGAAMNKVALLQVSTDDTCFLFRRKRSLQKAYKSCGELQGPVRDRRVSPGKGDTCIHSVCRAAG